MRQALENWQLSPVRTLTVQVIEPSGLKSYEVIQDGVALERMLRRILQNIAFTHYGFNQLEVEAIDRSGGRISLGDPNNERVQQFAEALQSFDASFTNEALFAPQPWKIGQPEAMVCVYTENPQRLCDAVNAMIERYGMQDMAERIITNEMEELENDRYSARG